MEHPRPRADPAGDPVHGAGPVPVHRGLGHRRQARAQPARPSAQRPDPHRAGHDGDLVLPAPVGRRSATTSSRSRSTCRSTPIIWFLRVALFVVPPIVFVVTRRTCLGPAAPRQREAAARVRVGAHPAAPPRRVHRGAPAAVRQGHGRHHLEDRPRAAPRTREGRRRRGAQQALPLAVDASQAQHLLLRGQHRQAVDGGDRGGSAPRRSRCGDRGSPARLRGRRRDPQSARRCPAPPRAWRTRTPSSWSRSARSTDAAPRALHEGPGQALDRGASLRQLSRWERRR